MADFNKHCIKCFYNQKENIDKYGVFCNLWAKDREDLCKVPEGTDVTKDWHNI